MSRSYKNDCTSYKTNIPRSEKIQQRYNELMSTIIPEDSKYHNRWMIDEEIANAIKDGNGNAIGTYTNLNRITTTTWTFILKS